MACLSVSVFRSPSLLIALLLGALCLPATALGSVQRLSESYLAQWSAFYPTRAFAEGKLEAAARFENFSDERLSQWLAFNRQVLEELSAPDTGDRPAERVDRAILERQIESELALWRDDSPLQSRPEWYATQVSQALTYLLVSDRLSAVEKQAAVVARLAGIRRLCEQGLRELAAGNRLRSESAVRSLDASALFFREALQRALASGPGSEAAPVAAAVKTSAAAVASLSRHIQENILPEATESPSMGKPRYSALLYRRSHGRLRPDALAADALEEIDHVRQLMQSTALDWWSQTQGAETPPPADSLLLTQALADMEADRAENAGTFMTQFTELTAAAEQFVRQRELATVPEPTTLYIASSPQHFAGAAVGGVYPAGPYAPQSDTLFYLPSIPVDAGAEAAEGFYRSFNRHFNTMIISHEMFPGHYMQYKVAVTHAPPIRSVFADGAYVEGWGSFSEELMLVAGWGDNDPLTWLAHYRKRLENATRAYVSVMVHTRGWGEEEVSKFAVERGLLAPQFALNLWQRVVHSPLQLTDYFVGYHQFKRLWRQQQTVLGERFDQRQLVDAVLRAGAVPVPALSSLLTSR